MFSNLSPHMPFRSVARTIENADRPGHVRASRQSTLSSMMIATLVAWLVVCSSQLLVGQESDGQAKEDDASTIVFAAMGDVPSSLEESKALDGQIADIPPEVEFVIHVGDIKRGFFPCLSFLYRDMADKLKKSRAPVFIIPGDNEWNDCPRPEVGWSNWQKYLLRLEDNWKHSFDVKRQESRTENFAFLHKDVLFIGLNLVGGTIHDEEAWKQRLSEDADWIEDRVEAHQESAKAIVVFAHAGPGDEQEEFYKRFEEACRGFVKPVLLLHGNGHNWRKDRPFRAVNVVRVQVDEGGKAPPVVVTIRPADRRATFRFDRRK